MDHERAFLQAIREEPEDDARRLIFADWLEEQGGAAREARAPFIRAQCRLASLPADDPHRDLLEDEAADLLAEHEHEWTRPLHGIAQEWRFARGFVEYISIRGTEFLRHAETLFDVMPVRTVHLLIGPKDIPHLAACPALLWVESLDFHRCHLNDRALQHLLTSPYLKRLNSLDLTGNGISTPGMQSLIHSALFGRLRRLDLSRNTGIGNRAVHLLARATAENLEELSLAATNTSIAGLQELFRPSHLPRLTNLNISGTRFNDPQLPSPLRLLVESGLLGQLRRLDVSRLCHLSGWETLVGSPAAANLQTLCLRGTYLGGVEGIAALTGAQHLRNLISLDLRDSTLGPEGARALANCPHLASLTELDLHSDNICDTGARALAESPYLTRLTVLGLAHNAIGGPGLKALAASPNLGGLRSLDLADNFIGEEALRALTFSANLARLKTLLLSQNRLGDTGAKVLAQARHLTRLAELDLHNNNIGKAGAEVLAVASSWPRLRKLDLRENVLTDLEETLLRERFGAAVQLGLAAVGNPA
jgi:uncharacterized protein (TIGR02996 family)